MLNGIIHPAVKEEIRRKIAKEERKNTNLFIVEAALLIEDNYEEICDELWYVYVEDEIRKKRLIYARGYDARKVDDIIAAQLPRNQSSKMVRFSLLGIQFFKCLTNRIPAG